MSTHPNAAQHNATYYAKNREKVIARNTARATAYRAETRAWIKQLKEETPCTDCHQRYPYYVMDFDHVSGDKDDNIQNAVVRQWSRSRLQAEIDKCDLVCANCHRARTYLRRVSPDLPCTPRSPESEAGSHPETGP